MRKVNLFCLRAWGSWGDESEEEKGEHDEMRVGSIRHVMHLSHRNGCGLGRWVTPVRDMGNGSRMGHRLAFVKGFDLLVGEGDIPDAVHLRREEADRLAGEGAFHLVGAPIEIRG
jgi:hypothetical protein